MIGCLSKFELCNKMVKIALQFKACLEGITKLEATGEDFRWYLKIKCNSCGTDNDNWIYITLLSGFTAIGIDSGTPFTDIDLNSKEWTEYDEKEGAPVSIFEVEHQFKKL
uniref:CXXC motif containing zinc binding protein n=1 Tax=Amphimedon queenslandica TaxID=400682 RepID=A0A1X7VHE0_AMPQE